ASVRSARTQLTPAGSPRGSWRETPATRHPASRNAVTTPPPAPPVAPVIRTRPASAIVDPSAAGLGHAALGAGGGRQRLAEDPNGGIDGRRVNDQRRAEAKRGFAALERQQAAMEGGFLDGLRRLVAVE